MEPAVFPGADRWADGRAGEGHHGKSFQEDEQVPHAPDLQQVSLETAQFPTHSYPPCLEFGIYLIGKFSTNANKKNSRAMTWDWEAAETCLRRRLGLVVWPVCFTGNKNALWLLPGFCFFLFVCFFGLAVHVVVCEAACLLPATLPRCSKLLVTLKIRRVAGTKTGTKRHHPHYGRKLLI